jgi:hypothetical protein
VISTLLVPAAVQVKADSPLVVNPDAVLPSPVAMKLLERIGVRGWCAVIVAGRLARQRASVRSTRGALPVFRPVGFPESPPEPGVPVVPAPGSPQVPLRTDVMVHPVAGHGVGMAVPR